MWFYRYFKRNVANTQITVDPSVTSGLSIPALTVTPGVLTADGTATPGQFFKVATWGYGSSVIDWWVGPTPSANGPTPRHIGDMYIQTGQVDSTGATNMVKLYIAGATASWKSWYRVGGFTETI
jgi:hypothetical protein